MKKLVQFGAGNIGRSFIAQLFSRSGYEVVFIDVSEKLVSALNEKREYRLVVKCTGKDDEIILIRNVRAVNGNDTEKVELEIAEADFLATSVGKNALPFIFPNLARGIALREKKYPGKTLDIIIAENLHGGASFFAFSLAALLQPGFPLPERVGLVETSIGKMVPIMKEEDVKTDPLQVFAEEYNELIVDGRGFLGALPAIASLKAVSNIAAYVDRKLFIHNMGHASSAYLGFGLEASITLISDALEIPEVAGGVELAMRQSAAALAAEYPADLDSVSLEAHIQDLLKRFRNRALGDTVFRVGRDLYRKLDRSDRLIGSILLAEKHHLEWDAIGRAVLAALNFRAADEEGKLFPPDADFIKNNEGKTLREILCKATRLDEKTKSENDILDKLCRLTLFPV